ncbi:protein RICE SALT SENSITIVE 3-like isoform X1 [Neltuma alba]|uniref:protein RICE SALT SENSITIVE 3-like isoform X1 n=1 Tax=Neltuma alba TaxID=207710 RepID=UPI0010A30A16|nr:protein RICE SALT SENSITIVE 3-like isoform X1 [Prosopis alba]
METGLPLLNCLLQHTLRSLCSPSNSSTSSKWVYAVFWRILPRNYPPPRWEFGGTDLDRSKGNKRNWILVWEDGFCDFNECTRAGSGYLNGKFGADVFFKMSHEVYSYGEGLLGKVAADNSHKWVYRDSRKESEPSYIASWNESVEHRPRAWEYQFNSGIETIVVIAVREGIVQLGSLNKVAEDISLVIRIQRKFSFLQSVPSGFAIQRPYPVQHPYVLKPNIQMMESNETVLSVYNMNQMSGVKRLIDERPNNASRKSINLGWNSPQDGTAGQPIWSLPPTLPLLPKIPSLFPSYNYITLLHDAEINSTSHRVKVEE